MRQQPALRWQSALLGLMSIGWIAFSAEPDPFALDRWTVRFSSSEDYLFGITAGSNGLVAVGPGIVLRSKEGADWNRSRANQGGGLQAITSGAGIYVAVGDGGNILTSPDGVVWSQRISSTPLTLNDVAYGAGRFVAVGRDGAIRTSLDLGATWLSATSGVSRLWGVAYGFDRFVAVGSEGKVLVSTNGMDWLPASNSSSANLFKVAFGDGKFVAVGSERTVLTSLDGFAWTQVLLPPGIPPPLEEIIYANGMFVGGGQVGLLMSSSNGVNWTYHQLPTLPVPYSVRGLAFDGEALVAVGYAQGSVVIQSDPVHFSQPRIARSPSDSNVRRGLSTNLSVAAHGTSPLTYRWQLDGVDLPDETNALISITNTLALTEGLYTVTIENALGGITSPAATLRVGDPPSIIVQPQNQQVVPGGDATFSIQVEGTPPFEFHWRQPGNIFTPKHESGRQSFWSVPGVAPIHAGIYGAIISNDFGFFTSSGAHLIVLTDSDADGLPDTWELDHGLATNNFADAALDSDNDGMSNLDEYRAGTNPTNATSKLEIRVSRPGEVARIEFEGESNRTYTVQYSDSVGSPSWDRLADLAAQTNRHEVIVPDPAMRPMRFDRVITPREP